MRMPLSCSSNTTTEMSVHMSHCHANAGARVTHIQMRCFTHDHSLTCNAFADVLPEINQTSSSATPRQNTFLVVSKGNTSSRKEKRIWQNAQQKNTCQRYAIMFARTLRCAAVSLAFPDRMNCELSDGMDGTRHMQLLRYDVPHRRPSSHAHPDDASTNQRNAAIPAFQT